MSEELADRLRASLDRISRESGGMWEGEALTTLRRSFERTLARVESGVSTALFRFQFSGGKPILFNGNEALPMEPERLFSLLNAMEFSIRPGEDLDLDGGLASWLIRPEVNLVDAQLRTAEETYRTLKSNRDRDHAATQAADTTRIRLRSRLTQLVGALQIAQKETGDKSPIPVLQRRESETGFRHFKPPAATPPPPPPKQETAVRPKPPEPPPPPPPEEKAPEIPMTDLLAKALRKVVAAVEGSGYKVVIIGDLAHQSWGAKRPADRVELLISAGEAHREKILSAARGEGLSGAPGPGFLLRWNDPKLGAAATVELTEAASPFHWQVLSRAKPDAVLQVHAKVATCEDLILLRAASTVPGHRDSVIELLKVAVNRIDSTYLKEQAQKAAVLEPLKSAWQEARKA